MLSTTDVHVYTLTFVGVLDEDFLSSFCPEGTMALSANQRTTLTNLYADQSGIIGVIRHLHNLGCVVITLTAADDATH